MMRRAVGRVARFAPLALLISLGGCNDQSVNPLPAPPATGAMFTSYVSFGNSITAGYQSAGMDDSTQMEAYPVLLAKQMGTDFAVPLLNAPGCPPPYTDVFTQTRLGGGTGGDCALRANPPLRYVNNVAVPGAEVIDPITNSSSASSSNALTTLLLGGMTQLQMAHRAHPTFVTVWIGNNDALGAVLSDSNPGDPSLVTPPDTFAARYTALMDSLDAMGTIQGGALIGVVQVAYAPYLTQGRAWKAFEAQFDAQTSPLNALDVMNNCLDFQPVPGSSTDTAWVSVPFPIGAAILSEAQAKVDSVQGGTLAAGSLQPAVMDCSVDSLVVTANEVLNLFSAVTQYNAAIKAAAEKRGWAYLDPNDLLRQLVQDPKKIRPFPAFLPTDPQHATAPFGTALSFDGFHPSAATHKMVANALIAAINATYSSTIPAIP